MKRILFLLLVTITCTNLAGGYVIAANSFAQQNATSLPSALPDKGQHKVKQAVIDLQTIQLNKEDSEDELFLAYLPLSVTTIAYSFIPDFKLFNKHFLLHYGTSIKDKELAAYILHQNFRL